MSSVETVVVVAVPGEEVAVLDGIAALSVAIIGVESVVATAMIVVHADIAGHAGAGAEAREGVEVGVLEGE